MLSISKIFLILYRKKTRLLFIKILLNFNCQFFKNFLFHNSYNFYILLNHFNCQFFKKFPSHNSYNFYILLNHFNCQFFLNFPSHNLYNFYILLNHFNSINHSISIANFLKIFLPTIHTTFIFYKFEEEEENWETLALHVY